MHCYNPFLASLILGFLSNRAYLASFGTASWASHEFERTRGKVTANMERNVSRHHTELVCLNARSYRVVHSRYSCSKFAKVIREKCQDSQHVEDFRWDRVKFCLQNIPREKDALQALETEMLYSKHLGLLTTLLPSRFFEVSVVAKSRSRIVVSVHEFEPRAAEDPP
ncbi:transposable element Tcb1 transposase [Trichonephila clavipes]|nr:transposable element Tcb1 transposase [Trichonephila clavipes]